MASISLTRLVMVQWSPLRPTAAWMRVWGAGEVGRSIEPDGGGRHIAATKEGNWNPRYKRGGALCSYLGLVGIGITPMTIPPGPPALTVGLHQLILGSEFRLNPALHLLRGSPSDLTKCPFQQNTPSRPHFVLQTPSLIKQTTVYLHKGIPRSQSREWVQR